MLTQLANFPLKNNFLKKKTNIYLSVNQVIIKFLLAKKYLIELIKWSLGYFL